MTFYKKYPAVFEYGVIRSHRAGCIELLVNDICSVKNGARVFYVSETGIYHFIGKLENLNIDGSAFFNYTGVFSDVYNFNSKSSQFITKRQGTRDDHIDVSQLIKPGLIVTIAN